jgi:uncharacterized damage-inducible protein DinB
MVRLEHILDTWRAIREETAVAVEEFPAAEFDFRPTPEVDSFRTIARHVLNAGDALTGLLLSGEAHFNLPGAFDNRKAFFRPIADDCTPAELAAALRESIEDRVAQLNAKPSEFYEETITRMDGLRLTRLEFLQWIKEHELTHRQQLFMYLRLKGLTPVTTRKRMERLARQAAK